MSGILENKNVLIMGVRNKWSIAWGIAKSVYEQGANLILTYLGDREKESIEKLTEEWNRVTLLKCDITKDEDIESLFNEIKTKKESIHGIAHCIAFANGEDLSRDYVYTSRSGFLQAMEISAYSLVAITNKAQDVLVENSSIITLSYYGAEKVLPGYNVMGVAKAALEASVRYLAYDMGKKNIRVNAISAGPVKTMSAKGISSFGQILEIVKDRAPLKRNVELNEIGDAAVFLLSKMSSAITGETLYVDSGYNIMGL